MALAPHVTRSWDRTAPPPPVRAVRAQRDWPWLAGASMLVIVGLALVFNAKTQAFADAAQALDLNAVHSADELVPYLEVVPPARRSEAASEIFDYLRRHSPIRNVGSLSALKLFPVAKVKSAFVVRTRAQFRADFLEWSAVYLASFWLVFFAWRRRRFQGDRGILVALHLLTGMGLILMVSLRDPLRDTLEFSKFAWGAAAGCALLLAPLLRGISHRRLANWCYTPLFAAFGLFALLVRFGRGPGGSDSKVNLGPFQPVELIKILLVLFLAGYFARKWERLRDLHQKRFLPRFLRTAAVPGLSQVLPVMLAVAVALGLFFVLKDLGPALVTLFVFLGMYAVARGRAGLAALGLALMIGGVTVGYRLGTPRTVAHRISMWLSPWDNDVHGGDQLAHSLWALSTGGAFGSGPGWGDPGMIPAGSTDLVLPSIGEEWGFAGVATVLALFAFLVHRALRLALRAPDEHALFLGLGLALLIAFEMLLISGGVLGLIPLSGVASPFLTSGNTAMLANFLVFALLLSISNRAAGPDVSTPFARPVRRLERLLAVCLVILGGAAAWYQIVRGEDYLARETRVFEEDGIKRAQRNPRLNSIAREIRRGTIYDRNGIPVATSDWKELERHRADYEKLGISIDRACSRLDSRHYPFGAAAAHVLGDVRTGENFHASNASLIERDFNVRLRGFRDYAELVPLVRVRHQPGNPDMERLRRRERNVVASLDIRLQLRADEILRRHLAKAHKDNGALVVMDARTGDVLALASLPEPLPPGERAGAPRPDDLLDRARYGQYPPGSTFKLVTAIAALRKNEDLRNQRYNCRGLGDGRVGTRIEGWRRPIHDDIGDHAHGTLAMERAIAVSCNAYFAQLGVFGVGSRQLADTARLLDIPVGALGRELPFAAYGQGEVLVTPFKMARVAALIAADGAMPQGRWVTGDPNTRADAPRPVLPAAGAAFLARAMREVVTDGTARRAMLGTPVSMAGKTGTAQINSGQPHSWFAGFAPYEGSGSRIAFAVVVEHGGYGARTSAPIAREIAEAAQQLGIIATGK